jgi:DNA-directed RNA polymerase subunit RPC12/RpoP
MLKLITEYISGFRIFKCNACGHIINISHNKKAICMYCGENKIDNSIV